LTDNYRRLLSPKGQDVHTGDLLAQIDPDPFRAQLEQASAKKGQDEAQLANARIDLKRYADLLAKEGVTEQVYDTQKALVTQLEATTKADQAAVESAKVQLAYTTIASPIDGRAGVRLVDQGNIVRAGDSTGIVTINQLKPISVTFTLPQQALEGIQAQSSSGSPLPVLAIARITRRFWMKESLRSSTIRLMSQPAPSNSRRHSQRKPAPVARAVRDCPPAADCPQGLRRCAGFGRSARTRRRLCICHQGGI